MAYPYDDEEEFIDEQDLSPYGQSIMNSNDELSQLALMSMQRAPARVSGAYEGDNTLGLILADVARGMGSAMSGGNAAEAAASQIKGRQDLRSKALQSDLAQQKQFSGVLQNLIKNKRLDEQAKATADYRSKVLEQGDKRIAQGGEKIKSDAATKKEKQDKEAQESSLDLKDIPIEDRKTVEKITEKTANKITIKNQIDSVFSQLEDPKISDDMKINLGRQLLKVLNSTEGVDAVGAEEVKRLGSLLEFRVIPNLTEPGDVFGRSLGEFVKQVRLTSDGLGTAIEANRKVVSTLAKRPRTEIPKSPGRSSPVDQDAAAMDWLSKNPKDPRAAGVMAKLKAKGKL